MKTKISKTPHWASLFVMACAGPMMAQTISSFNPGTVAAGGPQFVLTVNGGALAGTNVLAWIDPGGAGPIAIPYTAASSDATMMEGLRPMRSLNSQPSAAPVGPPKDISTAWPSERLIGMPC